MIEVFKDSFYYDSGFGKNDLDPCLYGEAVFY